VNQVVVFAAIGALVLSAAGSAVADGDPPSQQDLPPQQVFTPLEPPEDSVVPFPIPEAIGKRPGIYTAQDWREVIDALWGPGDPPEVQLAVFDLFWSTIDARFACFQDLSVDWNALRNRYRPEVADGVSRGRFAAILNHLSRALEESHTSVRDILVNFATPPRKGVPLMYAGTYGFGSHFGACLTPLADKSLVVYEAGAEHPLGLQPGDVILGYDGVPWKDLYPALLEAELPLTAFIGSSPSAAEHTYLMAAGNNWHLFDTIDIQKYGSGEIQHLSTSLLETTLPLVQCTDQVALPSLPRPRGFPNELVAWTVLPGTRVGYVEVYGWANDAGAQFYQALQALTQIQSTDGLIIDFRYNGGGNMFLSDAGLSLLFRDPTPTIGFDRRNSPLDHLSMVSSAPPSFYVINPLPDPHFYDRPIAVLTGPGAVSSGDQVALRMTFHPRAKTFGKSTAGAFNAPSQLSLGSRYSALFATADAYRVTQPGHYLTRDEFPVDYPVWLDRDDVARGRDTVLETALRWIGNRPPTASIRADSTTECTGPDGAGVRLDASTSTDPDSTTGTRDDIALFEWFEDFGAPTEQALGTGELIEPVLAIGSHRVTLRVRDRFGEVALAETEFKVVDTMAPTMRIDVSPSILWPPDHRLVPVHAAVAAEDRCGEARVVLTSVRSDQPDDGIGSGDGHTVDDVQDADPGREDFDVLLRAELGRARGSMRTYSLIYTVSDPAGNSASASADVRVQAP